MSKILVIEDNLPFSIDIRMMLEEELSQHCDVANKFSEAVTFLRNNSYDLIIADVFLDLGFKIFDVLDQVNVDSNIIFMTYSERTDIYEKTETYDSFLFLVKPFSLLSLKSAVHKCLKGQEDDNSTKKVFFKHQRKNVGVLVDDIKYIATEGNYCAIYTEAENILCRSKLDDVVEKIDDQSMVRIHRQFAVNLNKISAVELAKNTVLSEKRNFQSVGNIKRNYHNC